MARATDGGWDGRGWGGVDTTYPVGTWQHAVDLILDTLIPLLITDFSARPRDEVRQIGADAIPVSLAHGECFSFHSGKPETIAAGGNAIAVQIAAAAVLAPRGVSFHGRHWCRGRCPACVEAVIAAKDDFDNHMNNWKAELL